MPNHVTHRLIFGAEHAEAVFALCPGGTLDFNALVPRPCHVYRGSLDAEHEKDFPINWLSWNRENWGTKWGAHRGKTWVDGDRAYVQFDTAWSVPYPVLAAFCNRFQIPFEHRYFDEGHNFWGIETWSKEPPPLDLVVRTAKRYSDESDFKALCIELKGYDPDSEDED